MHIETDRCTHIHVNEYADSELLTGCTFKKYKENFQHKQLKSIHRNCFKERISTYWVMCIITLLFSSTHCIHTQWPDEVGNCKCRKAPLVFKPKLKGIANDDF